jgi:hypothetical protein
MDGSDQMAQWIDFKFADYIDLTQGLKERNFRDFKDFDDFEAVFHQIFTESRLSKALLHQKSPPSAPGLWLCLTGQWWTSNLLSIKFHSSSFIKKLWQLRDCCNG